MKKQYIIISFLTLLLTMVNGQWSMVNAQITIGGNVYGGGNAGDLEGGTDVTIYEGDLKAVFGGARMANVGGSAFLNIDGDNTSSFILIDRVYGGNDIAGSIGTSTALPDSLTLTTENGVDNTWNAFVRVSSMHTKTTGTGTTAVTDTTHNKVYIGQLFGGGNGEYTYSAEKENGKYDVTVDGTIYTDKTKPELGKTYLEVVGGSIVYAYGGGNNATVTSRTVICVDNPSKVVNEIRVDDDGKLVEAGGTNLLTDERFIAMGINTGLSYPSSDAFQIGRFFGGNNVAPMAIRPTWNLKSGSIRNVYSGGNRGDMTSPVGLLLEIQKTSTIKIDNLYGGCRMADVHPKNGDDDVDPVYIQLTDVDEHGDLKYHFPAGLSARVLVRGGDVKNVYGGNDVTGKVYGGNAVGIYTSIRGDVYGGGNGSYPYTDNPILANSQIYGDLYYGQFMADKGFTSSAAALNAFRPNAEQVSLRLAGTDPDHPVIIGGSVYCGGNSATLKNTKQNPMVELKIGSYVIADNVFLGNNGENMVKNTAANDILNVMAGYVDANGETTTSSTEGATKFNSMNLEDPAIFSDYMEGCAMDIMPRVVFDDIENGDPATYIDYTAYIGSLYCGGNVGSMTKAGLTTMNFDQKMVIFDKVVGGCNDAYVAPKDGINAEYNGGFIGAPSERAEEAYTNSDGSIKDRLVLNFNSLKIQPKRWRITTGATPDPEPAESPKQLVWNTVDANGNPTPPVTSGDGLASEDDLTRRFNGGNIYGGCYNSGLINGNVVINLNNSLIERDKLFDDVSEDDEGEAILYGRDSYHITTRHTGVLLSQQGMDVLGKALNVFGGGKGGGTEIWGSTTINLNVGYTFQIFGGSEEGVIGRPTTNGTYSFTYETVKGESITKKYKYDARYSCYVNLRGESEGVSKKADQSEKMAECEFMYGGGFLGPIAGNTIINLGKGRIFNSFAGSCNADILGHTETYIGRQVNQASVPVGGGFPWIRDIVYGGNDLGGRIMGDTCFKSRVRPETLSMVHPKKTGDNTEPDVLYASAYVEYLQGRADGIFGGCYGTYDYTEPRFRKYTNEDGSVKPGFFKPRLNNAFVNFRPDYENSKNVVKKVYGAGQGQSGEADRDKMQNRSYVLIDIPQSMEYYKNMEVFGAGAWGGVGMGLTKAGIAANPDSATAIIDLVRGHISAAYGASYKEGFTRRTLVNVPRYSTINIKNIFGGGYGIDEAGYRNEKPCDAYEAHVEFHSDTARVTGAIYGGNNSYRRTLYGFVNISAPVWSDKSKGYLATVYGAGLGENTWSQYTEINLTDTAQVYEVYGGGQNGKVLNKASVVKWKTLETAAGRQVLTTETDTNSETALCYDNGLDNALVNAVDNDYVPEINGKKYNTNVHIRQGATVVNYAYGGGLGDTSISGSGDVYGTTYIDLLGGTVMKDIYAAGTVGAVKDSLDAGGFTASANAYIEGGTLRNVFGGGWKGDVGRHDLRTNDTTNDIPGETNVIIGIRPDQAAVPTGYGFLKGVPAIQRNAYSGGEGGAVFGNAHLIINNGYIGYAFLRANEMLNSEGAIVVNPNASSTAKDRYEPKIDDDTYYETVDGVKTWKGKDRLKDCGNAFGGGYDVRSSVDNTEVTVWNGTIRNSLHGGGEIATIGRGAIEASGLANSVRTLKAFYKAGSTTVTMYNGHVLRNVFGGGKGYNLWGYGQQGTLYTDGYVFGQTKVLIHGGKIGTPEGIAEGYGNVFGGGDIGYVYSPGCEVQKTKDGKTAGTTTGSPGHYYYYGTDGKLTEDCKVVIAPQLQVRKAGGTSINGNPYALYAYVTTDDLNSLPKQKDSNGNWSGGWEDLFTGDYLNGAVNPADPEERGIHIYNGVFAGGNVSSNSDTHYANSITVYGNTTATLYDIYHRDFITVGTEHTGGIYGGGNLSMVDGYRELNITNYGTDYYGLSETITIDEYRGLSNRERAYFQLRYECKAANTVAGHNQTGVLIGDVFYATGDKLDEDVYLKLLNASEDEAYINLVKNSFSPYGFCSIYAGRLLNTIQRADFCGVFGSRMVLQGAKDRVADVGEDIDYTINRVGELSLNQQHSVISTDTGDNATHGNYFGIYNLVNYLGNLTSDVRFGADYVNGSGVTEAGKTYYSYKAANPTSSDRNKGQSFNEVALASGVFLELTTENSTADHKDYGYVTGVTELDLINVKKDLVGGGFVYAKNEHRVPMYYPNKSNVILSEYNSPKIVNGVQLRDEARTYKRYRYSLDQAGDWTEAEGAYVISGDVDHKYQEMPWQTSGNFIHPSKRIVDDCYPTNNAYIIGSANYSEAHYWYVKGDVYIYDQKVSAYTGSASAYSKEVHLPLTITAASHGQLQLLNVKPNLYAYYTDNNGTRVKIGSLGDDNKPIEKVTVNNESDTYQLNDVVSWWDWHKMSARDRQYFVTNTYVNCVAVKVDGVLYEAGTYVMDDTDFSAFKSWTDETTQEHHVITNSNDETYKDDDNHDLSFNDVVSYVFRPSNNIGHDTGYVLTFDMNSPSVWDDYYISATGEKKISKKEYEAKLAAATTEQAKQAVKAAWREGPTFTPETSGRYGKRKYNIGDIVTQATYDNAGEGKENMARAYVATESVSYTYGGVSKTVNKGTAISYNEWSEIGSAQSSFAEAWYCTTTVKLSQDNYLLYGELKTQAEIDAMTANFEGMTATNQEITDALTPAYICTTSGTFGGQQFDTGTNYSAIEAWCSLSADDRENFNYNFDALDLLTSPTYLTVDPSVTTSPAESVTAATFHSPYTDQVKVEYQAVYHKKEGVDIEFNGSNLADRDTLTNDQYETIRNDKSHYTHVDVQNVGDPVYIANKNFIYLGLPYGKGQVVDEDIYTNNQGSVTLVPYNKINTTDECYYCFEEYTDKNGNTVSEGTVRTKDDYQNETITPNYQQYFVIQGMEPTERTTLYVSRESDAKDVMKEKIVTVVYQYTYYEDEDNGSVKMTNELHVINIHLMLESGVPTIGPLSPPSTVLPGNAVGLKAPDVNPGLYEVLTSGWELFTTSYDDALNHRNGVPFTNNSDPVYWYQNQKNWVAFYSKTYLGKTYSNPVPLSVANYHDLDAVMNDQTHHLYVDKSTVDRPCKIYIDSRTCKSDATKSELDLLKDFFDLSMLKGTVNTSNGLITTIKDSDPETASSFKGHALLDDHVAGGRNLEFFLRSNVSPKAYTTWTPIANVDGQCFQGNLHGDGYTISGLNQSLFGNLCGKVYNLGVTGTTTFTGSGIANGGGGRVENCWFRLPAGSTVIDGTKAIFGGDGMVVNSYYDAAQNFTAREGATAMSAKAFYNGEVAYNLNGFYLNKRYYDHTATSAVEYKYLTPNADGSLPEAMSTGSYPSAYAEYRPTGTPETPYLGYVEHRFYDGDYRYAGGSVPESNDVRMRTITVTEGTGDDATETEKTYFVPIWPDDYIFFGQALNYGHMDGENGRDLRTHQELPSRIGKSGDRLQTTVSGNRVYRAPAYFRSKEMGVAHFNAYAVFAQTKKGDATQEAYKGMTAIDFTGGNGDVFSLADDGTVTTKPYQQGLTSTKQFFPPLLDDGGLSGIYVADLTRNLLVYTAMPTVADGYATAPGSNSTATAPGASAAGKTAVVVSTYLPDQEYDETDNNYHTVAVWDRYADNVRGHWVTLKTNGQKAQYVAPLDHMLVDLQEFNCPISYTMANGMRMWYQRTPDNYAGQKHDKDGDGNVQYDSKSGWESVCLPFQVDLVTTQTKGELTHFYNSTSAGIDAAIGRTGHEYWLRECTGITKSGTDAIATANFTYPDAIMLGGSVGPTKDYTNTFLWDYYYQYADDARHDRNDDSYQQYYQMKGDGDDRYVQKYAGYPRQLADKPYIIGFPGLRYYEFDLSGAFEAKYVNTNEELTTIPLQVITFASAESAAGAPVTIGVSDDELLQQKSTFNGFTFYGNYLNIEAPVGHYVMNADGNSYEKVTTGTKTVQPFRTYFSSANGITRSIMFSNEQSQLQGEEQPELDDEAVGTITITVRDHKIIATSTLRHAAPVRITNVAGITVSAFTIQPGETVETPVNIFGIYIVNNKKILVK